MTVLTVEYFNKIKDYIHPNLQTIVKDYQNGNLITPSWRNYWEKKCKSQISR